MRILLFSVGDEQFAAPVGDVEESIDHPSVISVPGCDEHARGVIDVRGRCICAYSPLAALDIDVDGDPGAALILGGKSTPIALLVSDVDDILDIDESTVRRVPGAGDSDDVLLGVIQREGRLVSLVDPEAIRELTLSSAVKR